jgi:catechol 2,3-dioxygenase-like lactoylglutathione lyase family enzyme
MNDDMVNVRYMVNDVAAAVEFYTTKLGFDLATNAPPAFASVSLGRLLVLLSGPGSSADRPKADGAQPGPGGWNRIHLVTADLASEVARLRSVGVTFRNDIVKGPGGSQILLVDLKSGQLFRPAGQWRSGSGPGPPADQSAPSPPRWWR